MLLGASYYPIIRREPFVVCYLRLNDASGSFQANDYAAKFGLVGFYSVANSPGPPLIQSDLTAASYLSTTANFVSVGDVAPLQVTTDISIEAWILPAAASQTAPIIGKMNTAGTVANPYALSLVAGKLRLALGNGTTSTVITGGSPPVSIPSHVVATSFRGVTTIYLNGKVVVSGVLGAQLVADGGHPLYIGSIASAGTAFNGYVSEVAIYNGALSARRVNRHFAIGQQVLSDAAHYKMVDPPAYSSIVIQNLQGGKIPTNLTAPVIFDAG